MKLTSNIIDMTYRFAWAFLKRGGRRDIDHNDLAHDALVKLANANEVEPRFLRHRVWLDVKSVFFEFYTNTGTRKHNILLDTQNRVDAYFDLKTFDPDTVTAKDLFMYALNKVYQAQPTQCEILMLLLTGKTVQEIAAIRGTSTQAVDELKQKARKQLAAVLEMAA